MRASDFEHSVKRVLANESGGTPFFMSIAGAEDFLKAGKPDADISGIEADDKTGEITIRLMGPDGTFANSLASAFGAPVPQSTPPKDQTKKPPPGVGPYVITKSEPEREFVLRKRAGFSLPGVPKPKLDQITVRVDRRAAPRDRAGDRQPPGLHRRSARAGPAARPCARSTRTASRSTPRSPPTSSS